MQIDKRNRNKKHINGICTIGFLFIIPLRYTYFVRENGFYSTEVLLSRKPSGIKQLNTMRIVLILTVLLTLISFIDFVLVTPIVGGYAPNNYSTGTVCCFV